MSENINNIVLNRPIYITSNEDPKIYLYSYIINIIGTIDLIKDCKSLIILYNNINNTEICKHNELCVLQQLLMIYFIYKRIITHKDYKNEYIKKPKKLFITENIYNIIKNNNLYNSSCSYFDFINKTCNIDKYINSISQKHINYLMKNKSFSNKILEFWDKLVYNIYGYFNKKYILEYGYITNPNNDILTEYDDVYRNFHKLIIHQIIFMFQNTNKYPLDTFYNNFFYIIKIFKNNIDDRFNNLEYKQNKTEFYSFIKEYFLENTPIQISSKHPNLNTIIKQTIILLFFICVLAKKIDDESKLSINNTLNKIHDIIEMYYINKTSYKNNLDTESRFIKYATYTISII